MVESILDHMSSALAEGENVKISGFGTFALRDKTQRIGRNPKTGVEVPISPRRVLTFRASPSMRDRIAGTDSVFQKLTVDHLQSSSASALNCVRSQGLLHN